MIILNSNSNIDSIMEIKFSVSQTFETFFINNISFILIIFTKTKTTSSAFLMNNSDWLTQFCSSINSKNKSNSSMNINVNKKRKTNTPTVKTNKKKSDTKTNFKSFGLHTPNKKC